MTPVPNGDAAASSVVSAADLSADTVTRETVVDLAEADRTETADDLDSVLDSLTSGSATDQFDDAQFDDVQFDDAEFGEIVAELENDFDDAPAALGWADLGVPHDLVDILMSEGMTTPFPVQIATLPDAMAGRDICGEAPTGSGKTLAYGIAALTKVGVVRPRRPHALILVPVRELAEQTSRALMPLGKGRRIWVQPLVGGVDINRHSEAMRRGAGVIVATPGRLMDLLNRGDVFFDDLQVVVIDEADRMADMGFMPQVRGILDEVPMSEKGRPQMLLFSATLDGDVAELIREFQTDPARHSTRGVGLNGLEDLEHNDTVGDHLRILVRHDDKLDIAAQVVAPARRSLMFVKNRFATERVALALEERGVPATHLHGGLTQSARNRALKDWATGRVRTVVATDMVARGLHMDDVDVVVHLDPPQDEKDYVHRSGRTGRAGAAGTVVNLLRKEQRRSVDAMERRLGVTSRESSLGEVVTRLQTQVEESLAAPVATKGPTPIPTVTGAEDRDERGYGERNDRSGSRDRGFGGGQRDRGPRSGGYGDRDRGPRQGGFDRDRGPRPGGFGNRDAGFTPTPRHEGDGASRPWVPKEEWDRQRAERSGAGSGDRPSWSAGRSNDRGFGDRNDRGARQGGNDRGFGDRDRGFASRPPRPEGDRPGRPWVPQEEWDRQRAERSGGFADRGLRQGGTDRGFGDRDRGFAARGPRPEGDRPGRPWVPQEEWDRQRAERPARPFDRDRAPRQGGNDRSFGDRGDRAPRTGGFGDRDRGFAPRGPRPDGDRPSRPWVPQEEWDRQRAERPARPAFGDRDRGFAGRPAGGAGRPTGGRSFGDRDRGFGGPSADRGPRREGGFGASRGPRPGGERPGGDRPNTNGYVPRGVKMWQAGKRKPTE